MRDYGNYPPGCSGPPDHINEDLALLAAEELGKDPEEITEDDLYEYNERCKADEAERRAGI